MLAAYRGGTDTVHMLLDKGADPNRLNARSQSILAGALFKGESEIVTLLIAAGANLDLGTPTARDTAAMFGQQHLLNDEDPGPSGTERALAPECQTICGDWRGSSRLRASHALRTPSP